MTTDRYAYDPDTDYAPGWEESTYENAPAPDWEALEAIEEAKYDAMLARFGTDRPMPRGADPDPRPF